MIIVDQKPRPWREGLTIAALLQDLEEVEFCAVVRLNGRLVSSPAFEQTRIKNNSIIDILPMVAGG